jgi:hypothetical protein
VVEVSYLTESQRALIDASYERTGRTQNKLVKTSAGEWVTCGAKHKGGVIVARASHIQEVCFPLEVDASAVYHLHGGDGSYISYTGLVAALELTSEDLDTLHKSDVVKGSVEGSHSRSYIQRRNSNFPHVHEFVSPSGAVQLHPDNRGAILRLVHGGRYDLPQLPKYTMDDSSGVAVAGEYVSLLDLQIALDSCGICLEDINTCDDADDADNAGDADDTFLACLKSVLGAKDSRKDIRQAVVDSSRNRLVACRSASAASAPFVRVGFLQKFPNIWSGLAELASPADKSATILMATNPAKKRQVCIPKGARIQSVERTLRGRLFEQHKDLIHMHLLEVERMGRCGAEYGTLLINLHLIRMLEEGDGVLMDGLGPNVLSLPHLMSKCVAAVRFGRPKHPALAATYDRYARELEPFIDTSLPETGNCIKYSATQLCGNFYSSVANHGQQRVHALLTSARRVYGGEWKDIDAVHGYVQGQRDMPANLPPEIVALGTKYRDVYRSKGLCGVSGLAFTTIPVNKRPERARRCFELFFEINRDMRRIRDIAIASGRWKLPGDPDEDVKDGEEDFEEEEVHDKDVDKVKVWKSHEFSLFPVSGMASRCELIDSDIMGRKCFGEIRSALGGTKDLSRLFNSKGAARSIASGWKRADLFRTNGTKLIEIWYLPKEAASTGAECPPSDEHDVKRKYGKKKQCKKPTDIVDVPSNARRVGDDPGDVNEHFVCEIFSDNSVASHVLTRVERLDMTDKLRKRQVRRVRTHAAQAMVDISKTRKRTSDLHEFLKYVCMRGVHRKALANAFVSRAARADAFEYGRLRTRQVDRFINQVIDGGERGKQFRRNIQAPDDLLYWGEGDGTKSALVKRRLDSAFKHMVKHLWVTESGSTKFDCMTGRELDVAWRKVTSQKDGKTRWVKDRDVRFRKPEDTQGSHPFPISPCSLEGKGFKERDLQTRQAVDRDGNAAYTINKRIGVPKEMWIVPARGAGVGGNGS